MTALHVKSSLLCVALAFAAGSLHAAQQWERALRESPHQPAHETAHEKLPASAIGIDEWSLPAEGNGASTFAKAPADTSAPASPKNRRRIDLRGNPIEDAVGDYRLDPEGGMYETHSPDTAVTRLGPAGV